MKASMFKIWFNVGPSTVSEGLKISGLTMRKTSPFYEEKTWVNADGSERLMGSFVTFPDNFEFAMSRETGLDIVEYETDYTLQVLAHFSKPPSPVRLKEVHQKLECFVRKHFKPFSPNIKSG